MSLLPELPQSQHKALTQLQVTQNPLALGIVREDGREALTLRQIFESFDRFKGAQTKGT